ncbi:MAG TPA: M28 family peptidase, partial [Blastocatellia bacterium]|nr:M28 family peptidase [Blastocatellia bacterium]
MHSPTKVTLILLLLFFSIGVAKAQTAAISSGLKMSPVEEFKAELESVPCDNKARLNAVKALFEKMGAAAGDIEVEDSKGVANVIIRKPGASSETIIIGAHYDKVSAGCGAIDNWTGIVSIAHLYRTVKDLPL